MINKKQLLILLLTLLFGASSPAVFAEGEEEEQYHSSGTVQFIPNSDPIDPVDPENPDPSNPVDPTPPEDPGTGTQGPLSVDYASSLDFGVNRISNQDKVYFARAQTYLNGHKETPNFVQVSDNRGTNSGWTLTVKQDEQFRATEKTVNEVLTGSQIKLTDPTVDSNVQGVWQPTAKDEVVLVPGVESVVVAAAQGAGAGTWVVYWGTVETINERDKDGHIQAVNVTKAIQLSVPGATPKDAVTYRTKLIWTLTDVPDN